MKRNKRLKIKETIITHILNNKKEYFIISLIFIIGILLGVFFINNINDTQVETIKNYISDFVNAIKDGQTINNMDLLKQTLINNIIIASVIWFFGTTVIGLPIVFGLILYRGFILGYTISACISIMGLQGGLIFTFSALFLQNIIFIPAIIAIAVSGFKLYKSIVKDMRKDNIKLEILRHTVFSLLMLIALSISAIIEAFVSTNILVNVVKYISI